MTGTRTPKFSLRPPARLRLLASPFSLTFSPFASPSLLTPARQAGTCAETVELTHDPPPIQALAADYLDICCYSAFTETTAFKVFLLALFCSCSALTNLTKFFCQSLLNTVSVLSVCGRLKILIRANHYSYDPDRNINIKSSR